MLSDEEKKAIESVKDMFEDVTIKDIDEQSITIYGVAMLDVIKVLTIVEKQSKEIEELNLKNEKLYEDNLTLAQEIKEFIEGTNDVKYYSTSFIKKYYISKDKIKAKIEELEKEIITGTKKTDIIRRAIIYELQSLLEKE